MATQVVNTRLLRDASASTLVTKALPAAGANNNTATIDLGLGPWHPEEPEIEISLPAMTAHNSASYSVTITLQDSADNITFASTDDGVGSRVAVTLTTPGIASTGTAARLVRFKLPIGVKQYIQFNQAVTSGGPTLTGTTVTYSVLF